MSAPITTLRWPAELKWIAEHADLHGIAVARHGTANGLLGLAALVQVSATLPDNFIAFEYTTGDPAWWGEIVEGLPDVVEGMIAVGDRPGMGVEIVPERRLPSELWAAVGDRVGVAVGPASNSLTLV